MIVVKNNPLLEFKPEWELAGLGGSQQGSSLGGTGEGIIWNWQWNTGVAHVKSALPIKLPLWPLVPFLPHRKK